MRYASSWSVSAKGEVDGEMRWTGAAGWLSHMVRRAHEWLFVHRRRHRPVHFGGREFSVPQLLSEALLPRSPAIYAIQVPHWWSGLKPIHFGTSHNLHDELMNDGHEGFVHWLSHRGAKRGLYVSFHVAGDLDHEARYRESMLLYRQYFPRRAHSLDEHFEQHRFHRSPEHRRHEHGAHGNGHKIR